MTFKNMMKVVKNVASVLSLLHFITIDDIYYHILKWYLVFFFHRCLIPRGFPPFQINNDPGNELLI